MSYKNVVQKFLTKISYKKFVQKFRTKVSYKNCEQQFAIVRTKIFQQKNLKTIFEKLTKSIKKQN